jgi:hypothetical protein
MSEDDTQHQDEESDSPDIEEPIQNVIDDAMPTFPEERKGRVDNPDRMTTEEHQAIHEGIESVVETLYDRGYSPSELGVVFHGFSHRMNASRYDPYQYDRIALTLRIRETIEQWRDEQPDEGPPLEIATVVEELGRHYRQMARRDVYEDTQNDNTDTDK